MAVEDIKEYIDEQKSIALLVKDDEVLSTESVVATLDIINSMLDELDNEWINVSNKLPNEDEMYYNGVRDYNDDTFRTISDKVLAQDENGKIYCGYFMGSCWHHIYNGKGRIKNEHTRDGEACWEFGVEDRNNPEYVISIGTEIEIIAWRPLPEPYSESKSFIKNVAKPFSKGMQDGLKKWYRLKRQ